MSPSSNSSSPPTPVLHRQPTAKPHSVLTPMEETKISESLQKVIVQKAQQLRQRWGDYTDDFQLEAVEKRAIHNLHDPTSAWWGVGVAAATYLSLRTARARVVPRLWSGSSPFSAKKEPPAYRWLDAGMDIGSSVSLGGAAYVYHKYQSMNDISKIPLTAGHSLVAEEFCPVLLKQLQSVERRLRQDKLLSVNTLVYNDGVDRELQISDLYLRRMMDFADNCERRKAYEQHLHPGLTVFFQESIPEPGVPRQLPKHHER